MTDVQNEKKCGCQTNGLVIFPVRYTVVPTYIKRDKPYWANLPSVTSVLLSDDYQYHVRTLREGYLYVYLPIERGNDKWQIYSIDEQGHLFKQLSNTMVKPANEIKESGDYRCAQLKKNSTHNSFITIANPDAQQKIYVAYSEFFWSKETLKRHEEAPEKRMQVIDPVNWKDKQSSIKSATIATQTNIEKILDYDPNFDKVLLPYDEQHLVRASLVLKNEVPKIQKFNYTDTLSYDKSKSYGFDDKVFNKNTTCHPWTEQQNQSQRLANTMEEYSIGHLPVLLAVDDPLGIAQELNGYYTEVFGKNEQYRQEREFEFNAKESYEYAMQILAQKESTEDFNLPFTEHPYFKRVMETKKIEGSAELPIFSSYNQLSVLVYEQYYGRINSRQYVDNMRVSDRFGSNLPYADTLKKFYDFEKSQFLYGNDLSQYDYAEINAYHSSFPYRESSAVEKTKWQINLIDRLEKRVNTNTSFYNRNEKRFEMARQGKVNDIKEKYAKHLNTDVFDKQYDLLLKKIVTVAEVRAKQVISWIKGSDFYQHIQDLNGNQWSEINALDEQTKEELDNQFEIDEALADNEITIPEVQDLQKVNLYGIIYSSIIERSTAGLELTEVGKEQIDEWFMLDKANKDNSDSLMWRGLANNSDNILEEIRKIIAKAKVTSKEVSPDEVYSSTPVGKLASYYKKTQGFFNTLNNYHKEVGNAKKIGLAVPKEGRLLKLFISKPALAINNSILRLSNVIFAPLNGVAQIPNVAVSYLFNFALCGVPKAGTILFLRSQNTMNFHILTSPLQTKVNLPGGVVAELTGIKRQEILQRNAKYIRIKDKYYNNVKQVLNKAYRKQGSALTTMIRDDTAKILRPVPEASKAVKDARLALIIGIFEAYNWYQLKQKQTALALDEFWTAEMLKSSMALVAVTAEIVAQYTKVVAGSSSIAAGRTKILSGIAGGVVSTFLSIEKFNIASTEAKKGNYGIMLLNATNSILYGVSAATSITASITYHIPWSKSIIGYLSKKALRNALSKAAVSAMVRIIAARALLLALNFWVGIIILLIEGLIWWLSNDELQDWLEYSALGTKCDDSSAYKDINEQKKAFKKVLESMFGIDEQVLQINAQNQITVKPDATADDDEIIDNEFNEYDILLLINQDLERQKQARRTFLAEEQAKDNAVKMAMEEAKSYSNQPFYMSDIFK